MDRDCIYPGARKRVPRGQGTLPATATVTEKDGRLIETHSSAVNRMEARYIFLKIEQICIHKLTQLCKCTHRYGPYNTARFHINYVSVFRHVHSYIIDTTALLQTTARWLWLIICNKYVCCTSIQIADDGYKPHIWIFSYKTLLKLEIVEQIFINSSWGLHI